MTKRCSEFYVEKSIEPDTPWRFAISKRSLSNRYEWAHPHLWKGVESGRWHVGEFWHRRDPDVSFTSLREAMAYMYLKGEWIP